jgi:hypothetical protein
MQRIADFEQIYSADLRRRRVGETKAWFSE